MKSFKNFKNPLNENSFYQTQIEKDGFVADEKLVMNSFVFSFIGMISFYNGAKDNTKIKIYFRKDQKLRIQTIEDTNNDSSLIIKVMVEKDFFKTIQTPNEITRFLVKMKQGTIDYVDPEIIRGWIDQIKPDKFKLLSSVVRRELTKFRDGGSLIELGEKLKANAKITRYKNTEFFELAKILKMDPAKKAAEKAAAAIASKPLSTSDDPDVDNTSVNTSKDTTTTQKRPAGKKSEFTDKVDLIHAILRNKMGEYKKPTLKLSAEALHQFVLMYITSDIYTRSDADKIFKEFKGSDLPKEHFNSFVNIIPGWPSSWSGSNAPLKEHEKFLELMSMGLYDVVPLQANRGYGKKYTMQSFANALLRSHRKVYGHLSYGSHQLQLDVWKNLYKDINIEVKNKVFLLASFSDLGIIYGLFPNNPASIGKFISKSLTSSAGAGFVPAEREGFPINAFVKTGSDSYEINYDLLASPDHRNYAEIFKAIGFKKADSQNLLIFEFLQLNTGLGRRMPKFDILPKRNSPEYIKFIGSLAEFFNTGTPDAINALETFTSSKWQYWPLNNFLEDNFKKYPEIGQLVISLYLGSVMAELKGSSVVGAIRRGNKNRVFELAFTAKALGYNEIVATFEKKILSGGYEEVLLLRKYDWDRFNKAGGIDSYPKVKKGILEAYKKAYLKYLEQADNRTTSYYADGPTPYMDRVTDEHQHMALDKKDRDDLDKKVIMFSRSQERSTRNIPAALSPWKDLSPDNKKLFKDYLSANIERMKTHSDSLDKDFWSSFTKQDYKNNGEKILRNALTNSSLFDSLTESSSTGKNLDNLMSALPIDEVEDALSDGSIGVYSIGRIFKALGDTSLDDKAFSRVVDLWIERVDRNSDYYGRFGSGGRFDGGKIISGIETKDKLTKKDSIVLEKTLKYADDNAKKLTKEYQELMTSAQPLFVKYSELDRKAADAFYTSSSKSMQKRLAAAYLSNGEFAATAGAALMDPDSPIKPFQALDPKRIKQILRYNNVVSEDTKISDKWTKSLDTLDDYIKTENKPKKLEDLQIETVELGKKDLLQMTADWHRQKRNGRHGETALLIKKVFNVSIPLQVESQNKWIRRDPSQEIINPMYHGTGSVAASMILRYGFAVIKSGDSSVVGRMLGDGVYGAIHIDKSQQYIGDGGFSRRFGTKGYIFEMNAALGEKNKDYRVAGLGSDSIRSPEWCVFTPNSQFKILKAYEVELVSSQTISDIMDAHPPKVVKEEKEPRMRFKRFLKEKKEIEISESYSTFTFVNGRIPTGIDEYVEFEDFKAKNPSVTIEPSAYGPVVVVPNTDESEDFIFTGPSDMMVNNPEVYEKFLNYISKE